MPLEFYKDAISLSGVLGTKLKSIIIDRYYKLWWKITSGGPRANYDYPTSIIDMNAATGEIFIKDTNEIILGSAGCSLDLKFNNWFKENPDISLVLVENNKECIIHLKNVIQRRYPQAKIIENIDAKDQFKDDCILIKKNIDDAIEDINLMDIRGRSIYFFDPLLSVNMDPLRKVYERRIGNPFQIGTEFIIFFFTSDWFSGREDFVPLPKSDIERDWSEEELNTVNLLDNVLGNNSWHQLILTDEKPIIRMKKLAEEYVVQLFELFRFVIPMPFMPKERQSYHLIFCSNFKAGASIITGFYEKLTNNKWKPNNRLTFNRFSKLHRSDIVFLGGNQRPLEWKLLWNFIKNYNNGKFDMLSRDVYQIEENLYNVKKAIEWLEKFGYIKEYSIINYNGRDVGRYELNWNLITERLLLEKPPPFIPLTDKNFIS